MSSYDTDILTSAKARALVDRMGEAANNLLASLAPDQRAKVSFDFSDQAQRTFWHYTPIPREGLPLAEMTFPQRQRAHQLVTTGLSRSGYVTAAAIIGLETILDAIEGWTRPGGGRDTGLYYVSIFGAPHATEPWGWKFEGHHISLNYTIVNGRIVAPTPTFFGANPAEAALSGVSALRPLGGVEDLARELVHSLTEEQRATAILAEEAPSDILTLNQAVVAEESYPQDQLEGTDAGFFDTVRYTTAPKGLAAGAMQVSQREMLQALVFEYINRMPDAIAEIEAAKLEQQGIDGIHLAWAGGLERRQPHYYRLQGVRFLVEYDNTQNDANHIHSVWRDPVNDFGAHLLAQHYNIAH